MSNITKIIVCLFILSIYINTGTAVTDVTTCGTLSSANIEYRQINNITATGTCITLTGQNNSYDGNGYSITYGTSTSPAYGIYINNVNYSKIFNTKTSSPVYSGVRYGIYAFKTFNSSIYNNNFSGYYYGMRIRGENNSVHDNILISISSFSILSELNNNFTFYNNTVSIKNYFVASNYVTLYNNTFLNGFTTSIFYANIFNNNITNINDATSQISCSNCSIYNNTFHSPSNQIGFYAANNHYSNIFNNTISSNLSEGFLMQGGINSNSFNNIYNNIIISNMNNAFKISGLNPNNLIYNNNITSNLSDGILIYPSSDTISDINLSYNNISTSNGYSISFNVSNNTGLCLSFQNWNPCLKNISVINNTLNSKYSYYLKNANLPLDNNYIMGNELNIERKIFFNNSIHREINIININTQPSLSDIFINRTLISNIFTNISYIENISSSQNISYNLSNLISNKLYNYTLNGSSNYAMSDSIGNLNFTLYLNQNIDNIITISTNIYPNKPINMISSQLDLNITTAWDKNNSDVPTDSFNIYHNGITISNTTAQSVILYIDYLIWSNVSVSSNNFEYNTTSLENTTLNTKFNFIQYQNEKICGSNIQRGAYVI